MPQIKILTSMIEISIITALVVITDIIQGTEFIDFNVTPGVEYTYKVTVVYDRVGESEHSEPVTASISPLPVPRNLRGVSIEDRTVTLEWDMPDESHLEVNSFRVYRDGVFRYSTTQTRITDRDELEYYMEYIYKVTAVYIVNLQTEESAASNIFIGIPERITSVECVIEIDAANMISMFPNPVRTGASATFDLGVKNGEIATLQIFNIRGQLVREFPALQAGNQRINWDMRDSNNREVTSGIYFYRLSSPSVDSVQRMVVIR